MKYLGMNCDTFIMNTDAANRRKINCVVKEKIRLAAMRSMHVVMNSCVTLLLVSMRPKANPASSHLISSAEYKPNDMPSMRRHGTSFPNNISGELSGTYAVY